MRLVLVAATMVVCAALICAAALAPAPPAALPVIVLACIGCPVAAATELPGSLAALRAGRPVRRRHLDRLRRQLDGLPEVEHPLGL